MQHHLTIPVSYTHLAASSAGDYGVAHAGGVAKGVTSGVLGLVVMLFAAYMISLEREKLIAWYEKCIPGFVKQMCIRDRI